MKKGILWIVTLIFGCFVLLSCVSSGMSRYNTFVPMEKSCVINLEGKKDPEYLWLSYYQFIDDKYVKQRILISNEGSEIVPAGKYLIAGSYLAYVGTGEYYTEITTHKGEYGNYTTSRQVERTAIQRVYVARVFDFKPDCFYNVSFDGMKYSRIMLKEAQGIYYADEDGNLYPETFCRILTGDDWRKYVNALQIDLVEDKQLGKSYSGSESRQFAQYGIQHINTIGIQFGNTYGFDYFSDPLNIHMNAEWGLGFGMGVARFDDFLEYFGVSVPLHVGGTMEFDFYKWNVGLGGGYLLTPLLTQAIFGTPYVQATINRFFYIEYYFTPGNAILELRNFEDKNGNDIHLNETPAPLYSAFGLGFKTVW